MAQHFHSVYNEKKNIMLLSVFKRRLTDFHRQKTYRHGTFFDENIFKNKPEIILFIQKTAKTCIKGRLLLDSYSIIMVSRKLKNINCMIFKKSANN